MKLMFIKVRLRQDVGDRAGSGGRCRIGAEVSSPFKSLVPAVREQIIGDDAMSDHCGRSRLREYV